MTIYTAHPIDKEGWTDWIEPRQKGYRLACCDCGLVHNLDFRIKNKMIQFKAQVNMRATGAKRRKQTYSNIPLRTNAE